MTSVVPPWVVFHVPHDSTHIPDDVRHQFLLSDQELKREIRRMTDHHTFALFARGVPREQVVWAAVSRLVVDVERFDDDQFEPMAQRGMGAVYNMTADQLPLRRELAVNERQELMERYYRPHHSRLEALVEKILGLWGRCLVIDCHSFPSRPLPYEFDQDANRPDICIGTDEFHTPGALTDTFVEAFEAGGFTVRVNSPFAGALVPAKHYRGDSRVSAVMVEVNRDLYLDEEGGTVLVGFDSISERISTLCQQAARCSVTNPSGPGRDDGMLGSCPCIRPD